VDYFTLKKVQHHLNAAHKDIDMNKNSLCVTKTYYNPNNNKKGFTLLTPKTKGSIRTFIIDDMVITLLKTHRL
jgi:hypothetical protein